MQGQVRRRLHPVIGMVLARLALGLVMLWIVTMVIFVAIEFLPGDLAQQMLGQAATEDTVAALRRDLGLDRPAVIRYGEWLANAATGDFGVSLSSQRPIAELIGSRLVNTFFLAGYAAVIAVPLAIGLGVLTALHRDTLLDCGVNIFGLMAISLPEFFMAYVLILLLSVLGGWFPPIASVQPGMELGDRLYRTFLPALTLTMVVTAYMMRMTRAAILNVLAAPYIDMAHLKGLKPLRIITRHALPNALSPIINVVALNLAYLIVGVVVVEVVFAYPGLGQLLVDAVTKRDVTIVQAACLVFAATFILLNLLADILSILANPRLRHAR